MIGVVMHVRVKEGRTEEFYDLALQLQKDVRENEPGCLLYQVMRQQNDPHEFVYLEMFADEASFKAHPDMPYHRAMSAAGWDCVDGQPDIRRYVPLPASTSVGERA